MGAIVMLALGPGTALGDGMGSAASVPGTDDDPIRALEIMPMVTDAPLVPGISMRGSSLADTRVLFDGFELPFLFRDPWRSIVIGGPTDIIAIQPGHFGVEQGHATNLVELGSWRWPREVRLTSSDVALSGRMLGGMGAVRYSFLDISETLDRGKPTFLLPGPSYDFVLRFDHKPVASRWKLAVSAIGSSVIDDGGTYLIRPVVDVRYERDGWTARAGISPMASIRSRGYGEVQHAEGYRLAFDIRAEVARRKKELAGLTDVIWRTGIESLNSRHDLDLAMPLLSRDGSPRPPLDAADPLDTTQSFDGTFWTRDLAAWSSIQAKLSPAIRATIGARFDAFTRGNDLALQPRGSLDIRLSRATFLQFAAGAYRRPPESGEELLYPTLNPERATQIVTRVAHDTATGFHVAGSLYFTDRRRLVMRDSFGELVNTGRGTDEGVELVVSQRWARWFAYAGASLSKSTRHDFERAATRPSEYDQPIRVDALARYTHKRWQFGARVQLYSGLPDTPIVGAVYNSDRDHYDPLYGGVYASRMPFHHQLDVRVDRSFELGHHPFAAFLDVSNVYANDGALAYAYSYDYTERVAIRYPIVPFAGLRGEL